jgi:uncharacterized membrane protein (UPF0182 family)
MPNRPERRRQGILGGRGRTIALVAIIVLVVLALSLKGIATFYTDFLWFRSLGFTSVWRSVLGARLALALVFIAAFFVMCWVNLYVADRLAPVFRPPGPEEDLLEPYHDFVGHRVRLVRVIVAGVFALIAGAGVSSQWNDWILFTHRVDFHESDPLFHKDIGFYVFQLPFLSFLVNWLFFSFVMIFLITAVAHYLNGGIRLQTVGERVTPQVKAHLSLLLGVLALVKAGDYWLGRYELTTSTRGVVEGATYTDVKVQLPAIHLLILISLLSFVLLLINIRRRGWQLPAVTVGLWAFVAIVAGTIYPAFVQRFQVEPAQSNKEATYVDRNINATRASYGLDKVEVRPYDYTQSMSPDAVRRNAETVLNSRLLDPSAIDGAFQLQQGKRAYYQFPPSLDVDRYAVDGKDTPVVVGVRELKPDEKKGWENAHLAYTHGYGVVMADATTVNARGLPDYLISELPPKIAPDIKATIQRPQVYFGENMSGYAIVNTGREEVDYTDDSDKEIPTRYAGNGGVQMGSVFRRAAFAIRFGQIEPLISNFVKSDSKVIFVRDVQARVKKVAPFLKWDSDPYPVVFGGRIVYVVDGYTTSSRYPYAQHSSGGTGDLAGGGINYVRNSVKAVVDAYDGTVQLFVTPVDDPIITAYQKAFPKLFTPYDQMDPELKSHLRYPQDMFALQTNMWARYHVADALAFLSASRQWSIAQNAPRTVDQPTTTGVTPTTQPVNPQSGPTQRVPPYYEQIKLPGESQQSFVTMRTFVNFNSDDVLRQLTAFMVGKSAGDPADFGKLVVYEFSNTLAPGPAAVAGNINAKSEISARISLLNQEGSKVEYGDLLLLPIENSVLYVRPMFVTSRDTAFPALQGVVVSLGDQVELGDTFQQALEKLFDTSFADLFPGGTTTVTPGQPSTPQQQPPPAGTVDQRLKAIISEMQTVQQQADDALAKKDLQTWAKLQSQLSDLVRQAAELSGVAPGSTTTTAPPATTAVPGAAPNAGAATPPTTTAPIRPAAA